MAYQNVGTPRFYISWGDWWKANGASVPRQATISPNETFAIHRAGYDPISGAGNYWSYPAPYIYPPTRDAAVGINFIAVLNHNIPENYAIGFKQYVDSEFNEGMGGFDLDINATPYSINYHGFSLGTFNPFGDAMGGTEPNLLQYGVVWVNDPAIEEAPYTFSIGCMVFGKYFDMNAPNLSLTMNREYGGTKEFTTYNGSSMSNTMWDKPPTWGAYAGPWELYSGPQTGVVKGLSRGGRRSWDLEFSHIADGDLWGSNQSLSHILNTNVNLYAGDESATNWVEIPLPNGDFSSSFNGDWITYGSVSINESDQCVIYSAGSGMVGLYQQGILEDNREYKLVYDLIDHTAGDIVIDGVAGDGTNLMLADNGYYYDVVSLGRTPGTDLEVYFNSTGAPISTLGVSFALERWVHNTSTNVTIDNLRLYISNGTEFVYNLLTDDNFFSQVWHKTLGGTLPFIFQPDNNNNNEDQFAICKFKENSLKATQSAVNVYDISVTIEEVW